MKKTGLFLLLSVWSLLSMAQTSVKKVVNITPDGAAQLTCYLPENPTGRAVVCCPGGGYKYVSMDSEGHWWAPFFNERGISLFVLQYRMPNGDRTIPISDAENAMKMVRDSADVWNVNREDVGIMGFSAGGHLASTISTHSEYAVHPNFSILFYPVITLGEGTHRGSRDNFLGRNADKKLIEEYSNDRKVRVHTTPPAIILLSNDDESVPPVQNGIAYYTAMRNQGNECSLCVYPTGGHGWGFRPRLESHDQMLSDLSNWLQKLPSPREDAVRIACIGNSITEGFGISMGSKSSWPSRLQQLIGEKYNVKNFGISARTLMNKGDLPYMNEQVWRDAQAFNPNIAIIKLGTNDSKPWNWKNKDDFMADAQQMINTLKALPAKPVIYLCTPIHSENKQWGISDEVITNEITPLIRKIAKKNKLQVIDLNTMFEESKGMMQGDNVHPTAKGAAQMAEIIKGCLEKVKK